MTSNQVEFFLDGLIENTDTAKLKWKPLSELKCWKKLCQELKFSDPIAFKEYSFSNIDSYYIEKEGGYVLLLSACYGNAPIFSPAFDQKFLVIKICSDIPFMNLCDYDSNGFKEKINALYEIILYKKSEQIEMPDAMYAFFNSIINGD